MFTRSFFGAVKSDDGFVVRGNGKNALLLKFGSVKYYVFIEYLNTHPLSVQIDRSGVWLDEKFKTCLMDEDIKALVLRRAEEYLTFVGISVK
ncbi:hypothetical protein [Asticcacaulis taihuensis]|uniref:hypothetical protein n=1 Tax=Asticcacaulis taihuensis TaxID=260084 RepID=UPI0026EA0946|nr:hypothetical protein [Asticcacaulis taihuensis]